MNIPEWLVPALRIRKILIRKDFYLKKEIKRPTLTLGNPGAKWTFCPDLLDNNSIIYSFGVGRDISFDCALIQKFHLKVYTFDPTPDTIAWIRQQKLPEKLHFYPTGIGTHDGEISFFSPNPEGSGSHSLLKDVYNTKPVTVPIKQLSTFMKELGHKKIDLLKLDIEAAEYEVLNDIIRNKIQINQLLVEFHHRFRGVGVQQSITSIKAMQKAGYKIFHVSGNGEEISFLFSPD